MRPGRDVRRSELFRRIVARRLATAFGADLVRRGRRSRDLEPPEPAVNAPGLWVECVAGVDIDPMNALAEAEADSQGSGLWPIAVTRPWGSPATVHIRLDDFVHLLAEWWSGKARRGSSLSQPPPARAGGGAP